jgi:membrane protease YdiL (CAAX protease family)
MVKQDSIASSSAARASWGPRQVGLGLLSLVGLWVVGGLVFSFRGDDSSARVGVYTAGALEGGLLALAWWFGPRKIGTAFSSLGFRSIGLGSTARYGLMALVGSLTISAFYVFTVEQLAFDGLVPPPLPEDLSLEGTLLPGFLLIVVLGPMAEEAFFRGFVFPGLAWKWGLWPGALASAGIFAATHGVLSLLVPAFFSGLLFVWAFRRSGSLWPGLLAHAAQNAIALSTVM